MKDILLVALGGMFGSVARYKAGAFFLHALPNAKFPWGTFVVNLLGCLLIGLVAGITERMAHNNSEIRLLLITGFLGGFTTFSAFGLETAHLLKSGESALALSYALGSVVVGVLAVVCGLKFTLTA